MLTTVQDLGRDGFGAYGVSPSGAADALSLAIGNRLVGNAPGAAALELTLTGGTFAFPEGARVALAGSDFGATLTARSLPMWTAHALPPGALIEMGATRGGARCYLCVAGGIRVPAVMGSASTHLLSGIGGFQGRALRKGDVIEIGAAPLEPPPAPSPAPPAVIPPEAIAALASGAFDPPGAPKRLRVTDGPQAERFTGRAWTTFLESAFEVTEDSNRMGLRLSGENLAARADAEMISEGVSLGAIQVTPAGQPIVLFVEQQTTGGYPKIANVVGADLFRLGQLRPRDRVRFERVSFEEARTLLRAQRQALDALLAPLPMTSMTRIDLNCDMGELPELLDDGTQLALMRSVTSVNVACGAHAGDERLMRATIAQAQSAGVALGAHPGYQDREHFGRRELHLSAEAIADLVHGQVAKLAQLAAESGATISFVKPHGALYNQAVADRAIAAAIADGVARWRRDVTMVGLAGPAGAGDARDVSRRRIHGGGGSIRGPALRSQRPPSFTAIDRFVTERSRPGGGTEFANRRWPRCRGGRRHARAHAGSNPVRAQRHARLSAHRGSGAHGLGRASGHRHFAAALNAEGQPLHAEGQSRAPRHHNQLTASMAIPRVVFRVAEGSTPRNETRPRLGESCAHIPEPVPSSTCSRVSRR